MYAVNYTSLHQQSFGIDIYKKKKSGVGSFQYDELTESAESRRTQSIRKHGHIRHRMHTLASL